MANLLVAAGLAYALPGALLVFSSFGGRGRQGDAPAYPRLLATRGVKRLDRRVGLGLLAFGGLSLTAAYYGYEAYGIFSSRWVDASAVTSSVQEKLKEGWTPSLADGLATATREG